MTEKEVKSILVNKKVRNQSSSNKKSDTWTPMGRISDHSSIIKGMVEQRAIQNGVKNKLRKVLFAADKGKLCCFY